jgi:transposase
MRHGMFQALTPAGLVVDAVTSEPERVLVSAHAVATAAACPECGRLSGRVHSRYRRRLLDLPSHGRCVRLSVVVRRFRCGNRACPRRIFGEPLATDVASRAARRTARLERIVHHLGVALGGRPAANLARRLMLPVSRDTLLRVVRRHAHPPAQDPVAVLGIDDFAWKRGQRYGTLLCDLQRRRIVDLLPDREPATVERWLAAHPEVIVVSRDRGGGYGSAASTAAPQAVQVADRWHLMENASAAFLEAVRRSMRAIRQALGAAAVDPAVLTCAERIQYEGFQRRQENSRIIRDLAANGASIKAITRLTGRSRKLVRSVLRGSDEDVFRCRASLLAPHLAWLGAEWDRGCRSGTELWRRLRAAGFRGSLRVVTEWATRRRRSKAAGLQHVRSAPPARQLSRLMTVGREQLSKADAITIATIETSVPALATARDLTDRFHRMVRTRDVDALPRWLADTQDSLLGAFAKGIRADLAAVTAALTEPWSNGQTEGQITKLKLVKRQMYGRASLDLLRARLVVPA